MKKATLQIGIISVLIIAFIMSLYVLLFLHPSNNSSIVTVIGILIGGLIVLTFSEQLSKLKIGPFSAELRELTKRVDEQAETINALQTAVEGVITYYEYEKLEGLVEEGPFMCEFQENIGSELKRLFDHGFIAEKYFGSGPQIEKHRNTGQKFDLKDHYVITERGRKYLQCRQHWHASTMDKA